MTDAIDAPEERARSLLDPAVYDYVAGGAGRERTLAANVRAFSRFTLAPRVLRGPAADGLGTAELDTAVDLPGARLAAPILVAPTAFHRLVHPDGERAVARATAAAGTVLVTGVAATTAVADVVAVAREVAGDAAVWFQLYPQPDEKVSEYLVRRAEDAGCTAVVLTVDSPVFGRHTRDLRNGFTDLPPGFHAENMRDLPGTEPGSVSDIVMSPEVGWEHIDRIRELTTLPVWLKGILHPDDARLAAEHGADGVMVSNHGGRQLDLAPATLDALPAVREAVRLPLVLDGGVRTGEDVALALALGADAVGVGRPVVWGLAADGERGVADVLAELRSGYEHTLTLCGLRGNAELTADLVGRREQAW